MEIISGRTFEDESLTLDNKHFRDCSFIGCILEYAGHPVTFERVRMAKCQYAFFGPARTTVEFLKLTGMLTCDPALWGEFQGDVQ